MSLVRQPGTSPTALAPDAPLEHLLDRAHLARPEATAVAIERIFAFWSSDGSHDRTLAKNATNVVGTGTRRDRLGVTASMQT